MEQGKLYRFTFFVLAITCIGFFAIPERQSGSASAAVVRWNVEANGIWNNAANWDSNPLLPDVDDDVYILRPTADVTVTHSSGTYCINSLDCEEKLVVAGGTLSIAGDVQIDNNLTINTGTINFNSCSETKIDGLTKLDGGILGGSSTVRFTSPLTWLKGTMSGSGTVIAAAGVTFSGTKSPILDARTLNNLGTTTFSDNNYLCGSNGAVFNNMADATVNLLGTNDFGYSGTNTRPIFNNFGTFTLNTTARNPVSNCEFVMNNTGSVNVQQGTLNLSGGGISSGAFSVASGATLTFAAGTYILNGPAFSNSGILYLNGGTLTLGASTATSISGAVNLNKGTIDGPGDVTFSGPLTWLKDRNGGRVTMSGSGMTNATGGIIFSYNGDSYLDGRVLNNSGIATFYPSHYMHGSNGAVLNNLAGGVVELQGLNSFKSEGAVVSKINNAGAFRLISAATSQSTIEFAMNNTGIVEVQNKTLSFTGGVTQLTGTTLTGGEWIVRANSTLTMLPSGNIVTNQGKVTLDGIGSTFTKIITLADNQGSFSILNGRDFSTVGDLANSGSMTVGTDSDLSVNGDLSGTGSVIVNGTLTTDSLIQDTLTIGAGGVVTIRPISGGPLAADTRISAVPEPSSIVLLLCAAGLLMIVAVRKR